jgi:serine/threonine protein kinase
MAEGPVQPGLRVGSYLLREKIGSGGFGTVYRGVHAHDEELQVAIKVIHPFLLEQPDVLVTVRAECRAVDRLDHPNIVRFRDLVVQPDVTAIVLELLQGRDLCALLRAGLPPVDDVVVWMEEVLGALAVAHDKGLIHRDIKPSNLFLVDDGRIKVMDFGIAHIVGLEHGGRRTGTGLLRGSIDYVAPERFSGAPLVPAVDIYAVGLTFWELLVGQRACPDLEDYAKLGWHLQGELVSPATLRPGCPAWLGEVILKLARRDPSDRPATGSDALRCLRVARNAASGRSLWASETLVWTHRSEHPPAVSQSAQTDVGAGATPANGRFPLSAPPKTVDAQPPSQPVAVEALDPLPEWDSAPVALDLEADLSLILPDPDPDEADELPCGSSLVAPRPSDVPAVPPEPLRAPAASTDAARWGVFGLAGCVGLALPIVFASSLVVGAAWLRTAEERAAPVAGGEQPADGGAAQSGASDSPSPQPTEQAPTSDDAVAGPRGADRPTEQSSIGASAATDGAPSAGGERRPASERSKKKDPTETFPLRISTSPAGASVSINGERAGLAPVAIRVPLGDVTVRASLDGHLDASAVVVVPRGGTSLRLELRPSGDAQKTAASSARSSDAIDAVLVVGEVSRAVGRSAARKAVAGASSATSRCLRGIPRASIDGASVTLWVDDDGVVTKVQVGGSLPDAAAGCLKSALSALIFSVDGGGTVAVLVREG